MLLLDCGNTALKCLFNKKLDVFLINEPQFEQSLRLFIKSLPSTSAVILSSVSDQNTLLLIKSILTQHFTKPISIAQTESNYGDLKNAYTVTQQLGVDRWLAMIATQNIETNRIVIDAGSWIKMDVVLAQGEHLGGVIISRSKKKEAELFQRFALSQTNCNNNTRLFGESTQQCICLSQGQYDLDAVNNILPQWLSHLKSPCQIIVTGGDAQQVVSFIQNIDDNVQKNILDIQQIENLVLLGLSTRY